MAVSMEENTYSHWFMGNSDTKHLFFLNMDKTQMHCLPYGQYAVIDSIKERCSYLTQMCFQNGVVYGSRLVYRHWTEAEETLTNSDNTFSSGPDLSISKMDSSEADRCSIEVIVNDFKTYRGFWSSSSLREQLSLFCKKCLLGFGICKDFNVLLAESKLAKVYGITQINVKDLKTNTETQVGIISMDTEVQVTSLHSDVYNKLRQSVTSNHLGGLNQEIEKLALILRYNNCPSGTGTQYCPRGVLLHGPPGCGKSSIGKHLAHKCEAILLILEASEIYRAESGAGAAMLQNWFEKAKTLCEEGPVILFIDDIDTLCPRHENVNLWNRQVTSALLGEMDKLQKEQVTGLLVFGTTNFISSVHQSLRRPGRFDEEVLINVPTQAQRLKILQAQTSKLLLADDVSLTTLAQWSTGYVGADLKALCETAVNLSIKTEVGQAKLTMSDFKSAFHSVTPSLKRSSDCSVDLKPVKWKDIGGLEDVKIEIRQSIEWPLLYPEILQKMDLSAANGVLLYGPPGCCKTMLVRAAASSTHVAFLALNGAQIYSPYVGESERILSEAFRKARALSPCILFIDEFESIVGKRTANGGNSRVQERILTTLLNEMDGIGARLDEKVDVTLSRDEMERQKVIEGTDGDSVQSCGNLSEKEATAGGSASGSGAHVILVGATNRPDMLDAAILRPGRLDKKIFVPPPDEEARKKILEIYTTKMITPDLDLGLLSKETEFYTGADLKNLCKEAFFISMREGCKDGLVNSSHFSMALKRIKPSLSLELLQQYKY